MKRISLAAKFALALVMAGALMAGPVMADKGGKGDKGGKQAKCHPGFVVEHHPDQQCDHRGSNQSSHHSR
ncbi:MAG: hypothetical protein CVU20_15905 [Betaproteobacteria bacterium HGW-Betaproteobacteria-14]|nr:MAG: hypothetical protein CVU20_15905 [Betaproteobacteria bacterium HGW-Betaproteobacteria-14]